MIRIVIADDHTIVREGLQQLLGAAGGFEVVGEARDGIEVMQRVRELEFDVLLLDISMPGKSGLELIKQVRSEKPRLRVLVLSMHEEHQYAVRAIKSGASGYLTKESASAELATALRKIAAGGAYITPRVGEELALGTLSGPDVAPHTTLSDREFQVFGMLASGKSVSDIAEALHLSVKTISTHKARLMQKLGVATSNELIRYALQHRLSDDMGTDA
ncbi:MAG: response regulator transcription factor [Pseudomonadota bacterium]|nr:response regulator transcription factor [Pseudomonadota bacterium]